MQEVNNELYHTLALVKHTPVLLSAVLTFFSVLHSDHLNMAMGHGYSLLGRKIQIRDCVVICDIVTMFGGLFHKD